MSSPAIEEFARLLMREVRDGAIRECDISFRPSASDVISQRWRSLMNKDSIQELAETIIADSIDSALFKLLFAIDDGVLRLSFTASDGTIVDLKSEGGEEMAGWFMGTGGWRAKYSQQRFVDDFKDLA